MQQPSDTGVYFKLINDKLRTKADADLRAHGLTMTQSRVLRFLSDSGGEATQKEIEDFLSVSHPTVVGIVSRLREQITEAKIHTDIMGSDHCPVEVDLAL